MVIHLGELVIEQYVNPLGGLQALFQPLRVKIESECFPLIQNSVHHRAEGKPSGLTRVQHLKDIKFEESLKFRKLSSALGTVVKKIVDMTC